MKKDKGKDKAMATHADHSDEITRLRRIKGQIEGVERMIEEGRYCIEIVNQVRSIMAALRSAEGLILERHVRHCVADAINASDSRVSEQKVKELLTLFQKR